MSSLFNSGKSSIISSKDIPVDNQERISDTQILVPVIIGFPNLISGFIEIKFCQLFSIILLFKQICKIKDKLDF